MHSQDDALVGAASSTEGGTGRQGALSVDDALVETREGPGQRPAKECLVPVAVPPVVGGAATGWSRNRTPKTGAISGRPQEKGVISAGGAPFASRYRFS